MIRDLPIEPRDGVAVECEYRDRCREWDAYLPRCDSCAHNKRAKPNYYQEKKPEPLPPSHGFKDKTGY